MTATGGFYEQRTVRPSSLAVVIGLHAAALAAVMLAKPTIFVLPDEGPLIATNIPIDDDPPPVPPPSPRIEQVQVQPPISRPTTTPTVIDLPPLGRTVDGPPVPAPPLPGPVGTAGTASLGEAAPRLTPLRIDAEFDPRFADALQPPYPASEQRAEREGTVRVRVTIGPDGRVKAIQRLGATSDAFWAATERHARSRWRFRPATLDGVPVESTKTLTLHFRLEA
ncbi:energy transducer TonB [Sphingosinicella terrae]|uniref:energy transducer TonB n=1 Tax=Sphingosinicella terrae TaxID=2172047 RepID=UPI0013B46FBB|nr:energy transducer TonB [Sphingosinicella terrae]